MPHPRNNAKSWLAVIALMVAACPPGAMAEGRYFVDGKQVDGATYESSRLANQSMELLKGNKVQEAGRLLEHAIQRYPQQANTHAMLGLVMARLGDNKQGQEQLQTALAIDPEMTDARLSLATLYEETGQLKEAIGAYEEAQKHIDDADKVATIKHRAELIADEIKDESSGTIGKSDYLSAQTAQGMRRFADPEIKVYIESGSGVAGYDPAYATLLRRAFSEWGKALGQESSFAFTNQRRDAQIVCHFVDSISSAEDEGGETKVSSLLEAIKNSDVRIACLGANPLFPLTPNMVSGVCLHEIGHALGLVAHSRRSGDVMYWTMPLADKPIHLSARDVNTVRLLYQQPLHPVSQFVMKVSRLTQGNEVFVLQFSIVAIVCIALFGSALFVVGRGNKSRRQAKRS